MLCTRLCLYSPTNFQMLLKWHPCNRVVLLLVAICIISPTQNLSREDNSSTLSDSFVTRSISLDTNHPPSVPLVIAQSEECTSGVQDNELILEIVPESLELLRKLEKPVAPVAICGPYRTGKS